MKMIRTIEIEKKLYRVTISDDAEALQAAYAAGGAIIGILDRDKPGISLKPAAYAVEDPEDIDDAMLEEVVRRRYKMPWIIQVTKRLVIREFTAEDPVSEERVDGDLMEVFSSREGLEAYIENQYPFFGCGIWALTDRETGCVIGKAGIAGGELGYHVYRKYRRKGYAREACSAILSYARETLGLNKLYVRTRWDNTASVALARSLGFRAVDRGADCREDCGEDCQQDGICLFELNPI